MSTDYELELRHALAEGVLSREEADALRAHALQQGRSPLELLVEQGRLTEESLASLRVAIRPHPATPPQPQEPPTLTPQAAAAAPSPDEPPFPVPEWDRYQPVRFLGQGGMGRVFLAYDSRLRRNVALKFVKGDDPELTRRFIAEARAQARVSHERVCQVYEVGEVQGRAYIAMQYVQGQHLGQLAHHLTLEQKVLLMAQAAEGVHAAHRAGLIHRDLKPSNILVERSEEGGLRPYVMDFGLARDWQGESTATGTVLGTPHYMAPEQARGEQARLDRRADVYSLGATLYFLLTGQPPVEGSNPLEVLHHLQSREPRPPRALVQDTPVDLEAIALKCLERERSARYESARALAEELQRFLNGEPVQARPIGPWARLRRQVRRHRLLVSVASAALVLVALALGQAVQARREVTLREQLSRRFTEQVERVEALARYSALAPLHDTRPDRQALRDSLQALESEVLQGGLRALGPGYYALGRGLLALGEEDKAREHLERAWAEGLQEPRVAWALALALGRLYQQQLLEAEQVRARGPREARLREVEQRYREPALSWLRKAEGTQGLPPRYVAALLAFYESRHEQALAELQALGGAQPWFYEAPLLRCQVLLARASRHGNEGRRPQALEDLEAGRRACAQAAAIGESAPEVHRTLAELEFTALRLESNSSGEVLPPYTRGMEALGRALAAAPEQYELLVLQARFHRRLAEHRGRKGEEVQPLLEQALAAARTAQVQAPQRPEAWVEIGRLYLQWARSLTERGQSPSELLRQAQASFERVPPQARNYEFFTNLGLVFNLQAEAAEQRGEDSLGSRAQAVATFREAIALNERVADAWISLGTTLLRRASLAQAPQPEEDLEQARVALERARALDPQQIVPCFYGAEVHELRATRLEARGGEPGPELEQARALYQQGLSINPKLPQLHNGLGSVLLRQADLAWEQGREPAALLAQAQATFEQAMALAPQQGFAYNNLGEVHALRAVHQQRQGEDPTASVSAALQAYRQALERMPGQVQPRVNTGKALQAQAAWAMEQGQPVQPAQAQAEQALRRALEGNPKHAQAWRYLGEVLATRARWKARQGQARGEDFSSAAEAFRKALELRPEQWEDYLPYGHFLCEWAAWRQRAGEDSTATLEQARQVAERVLAARPRWARARALHAHVLLARAGAPAGPEQQQAWRTQAREELEQALAANSHLAHAWRRQLAVLPR